MCAPWPWITIIEAINDIQSDYLYAFPCECENMTASEAAFYYSYMLVCYLQLIIEGISKYDSLLLEDKKYGHIHDNFYYSNLMSKVYTAIHYYIEMYNTAWGNLMIDVS